MSKSSLVVRDDFVKLLIHLLHRARKFAPRRLNFLQVGAAVVRNLLFLSHTTFRSLNKLISVTF